MKFLSGVFLFLAVCASAGQSPAPASTKLNDAQLAAVVKQQFGQSFAVPADVSPKLITGDFDGDGIEDAVIVADSKDPMPDSYGYKYEVSDPYNSYFGYGNPQVTAAFSVNDPRSHMLVVIFGAQDGAWRAAAPKAKFVIVNLPFDSIEAGRMLVKKNKPPITVIKARETDVMDAAVWWDAKKKRWKWEPGGMGS